MFCGCADAVDAPAAVTIKHSSTTVVVVESHEAVEQDETPVASPVWGIISPDGDIIDGNGIVETSVSDRIIDVKLDDWYSGAVLSDNGVAVMDDWCDEEPCASTVHLIPDDPDHIIQFFVSGESQ